VNYITLAQEVLDAHERYKWLLRKCRENDTLDLECAETVEMDNLQKEYGFAAIHLAEELLRQAQPPTFGDRIRRQRLDRVLPGTTSGRNKFRGRTHRRSPR